MSNVAAQQQIEPVASAADFHTRLKALNARFIRYYPDIATLFEPYAEAMKSRKLDDGTRTKGETFDPDVAAKALVRVIDLTGTSTLRELQGTDWFQKDDDEFASELGVSVHRFRAARRFLAGGGIDLIERRDLRLPNRTHYRALFERIDAFFLAASTGWGQAVLPLQEPTSRQPNTGSTPGSKISNPEARNIKPGDAKNQTPSSKICAPNKEDLYRKNKHEKLQIFTDDVESARTRARNGESYESIFTTRYRPELDGATWPPDQVGAYCTHALSEDLRRAGEIEEYLRWLDVEGTKLREMVVACTMRGIGLPRLKQHRAETMEYCRDRANSKHPIENWLGFWIVKVLESAELGVDARAMLEMQDK